MHPVQLEYATPQKYARAKRTISFGAQMMLAGSLASVFTILGSWSGDGRLLALYGTLTWCGIGVTLVYRWLRHNAPHPKETSMAARLWRPMLLVLGLVTLSLTFQYGSCPHQRYWGIGPYLQITVTDPRGPCNNGKRPRLALLYLFDD